MIDLYDGNNVMRRAMEKSMMPLQERMSLRMRFEQTCAAPAGTQIWVWDGRDHNARRRDIYPLYKTNREPCPENIFAQINLWKELLRWTPATQIEAHGWEADDVIGTLVRKRPGMFRVHTNDMDYGQIAHLCHLNGVNLKGVPARWVALYKAMVGDSSDNIKGIRGFGPGMWLKLEQHWPQIERAIVVGEPGAFEGLPFTKAIKTWLTVPENIDMLQNMLLVTHFQAVPDDELNGGVLQGQLDVMRGRARMQEFFL